MFSYDTVPSTWLSSICAAVAIVLASTHIAAEEPGAVRTLSPVLAATVADGERSSVTFRALIEALAQSDVIVHVLAAPGYQSRRVGGTMRFVNAVASRRYLRITIDERLPDHTRTAILGHELHHAVEVARAPWVVDSRSFDALYRHIGRYACACPSGICYETIDAQQAENRVLREMRAALTAAADGDCAGCR